MRVVQFFVWGGQVLNCWHGNWWRCREQKHSFLWFHPYTLFHPYPTLTRGSGGKQSLLVRPYILSAYLDQVVSSFLHWTSSACYTLCTLVIVVLIEALYIAPSTRSSPHCQHRITKMISVALVLYPGVTLSEFKQWQNSRNLSVADCICRFVNWTQGRSRRINLGAGISGVLLYLGVLYAFLGFFSLTGTD